MHYYIITLHPTGRVSRSSVRAQSVHGTSVALTQSRAICVVLPEKCFLLRLPMFTSLRDISPRIFACAVPIYLQGQYGYLRLWDL